MKTTKKNVEVKKTTRKNLIRRWNGEREVNQIISRIALCNKNHVNTMQFMELESKLCIAKMLYAKLHWFIRAHESMCWCIIRWYLLIVILFSSFQHAHRGQITDCRTDICFIRRKSKIDNDTTKMVGQIKYPVEICVFFSLLTL